MPILCARFISTVGLILVMSACTTMDIPADKCPANTQQLLNCPPLEAVADPDIAKLYDYRTWVKPSELDIDPIQLGRDAEIPKLSAKAKFLGSGKEDALNSLAAKIWLIEHAEHTIDLMYYIYKSDLIGNAVMGALCDAVKRGVDVRFMVDSLGSVSLSGTAIKALASCTLDAGFMHDADGNLTVYRARIQTVVFNALSNVFINPNRRSHDKLLVVDGMVNDKATVITGGRNISLSYYGILADGSHNPDTYNDAEILLKPGLNNDNETFSVAGSADIYYTLLFFFKNNKYIKPTQLADPKYNYAEERQLFKESLEQLKQLPAVEKQLQTMPEYLASGFADAEVRLAHEFGNLVNKKVVTEAMENLATNQNSIMHILKATEDLVVAKARMVSPYLFLARYEDKDGNVVDDEAANLLAWLERHPDSTVEIVTNSVLTSDNVGAQSVIDMETAPSLLMSDEQRAKWVSSADDTELNVEFISGAEWQSIISHPRIHIYETGRLDDVLLGGDTPYGKLHAKYIVYDNIGFVGTANFDYRSRLYNNEMGYFFDSESLAEDINRDFDHLIESSYLWGSPEWIEMRAKTGAISGMKGWSVRHQRGVYKFLQSTGLQWQF